jgi:hypothetical protein
MHVQEEYKEQPTGTAFIAEQQRGYCWKETSVSRLSFHTDRAKNAFVMESDNLFVLSPQNSEKLVLHCKS